jgi:methyl-accepting chemotaxis protein
MNPFAAIARKFGLQQQLALLLACGLLSVALFGVWWSSTELDAQHTGFARTVLWTAGFAVLVFMLIGGVALRLTAPLRTLAKLMVRAGNGDASVRADEQRGPRDVASMARTFNRMMDSSVRLDEQAQQSALRLRQMVEHWPAGAIYIEDGAPCSTTQANASPDTGATRSPPSTSGSPASMTTTRWRRAPFTS